MDTSSVVKVLLATYNGEKFLNEQLDSLFNQTNNDWSLVVLDDGSTDNTLNILSAVQDRYPERVSLLKPPPSSSDNPLGARDSFGFLLSATEADYYYFCDQDDRWRLDKIDRMHQFMQELESGFGHHTPLLIHTDLRVVDQALEVISGSFWHYQDLDPDQGAILHKLIVQNVVTGCAMMINRALCDLALPIPHEAILHDWWLALVAAAFGKIGSITDPLVDYRQHGSNAVGAQGIGADYFMDRIRDPQGVQLRLSAIQTQAAAFAQRFEDRLGQREYQIIKGFANLSQRGFLTRRFYLLKYGFRKNGLLRNLGLMRWI